MRIPPDEAWALLSMDREPPVRTFHSMERRTPTFLRQAWVKLCRWTQSKSFVCRKARFQPNMGAHQVRWWTSKLVRELISRTEVSTSLAASRCWPRTPMTTMPEALNAGTSHAISLDIRLGAPLLRTGYSSFRAQNGRGFVATRPVLHWFPHQNSWRKRLRPLRPILPPSTVVVRR